MKTNLNMLRRRYTNRRSLTSSNPDTTSSISVTRTQNLRRRRRLELRRVRYLCQTNPNLAGGDNELCFKESRIGNEDTGSDESTIINNVLENHALVTENSSDQSSENDVMRDGVSSFNEEMRLVRENTVISPCFSHGSVSVIGRRGEMEDAVTVELGFLTRNSKKFDFYGVYDGHGGSLVADACRDQLHQLVLREIEDGVLLEERERQGEVDWEMVMAASFEKMDEEVYDRGKVGVETCEAGSTAVVAVVGEDKLVVANCGDSRAVLFRGGLVVPLSNDHKPDREDELERIEGSGGMVINWNGNRVSGVLATSRSIGDWYLKPFVISKPEITVSERTDMDEFLILASDGLWDVISNEVACQVVRRCLDGRMRRIRRRTVDESNNAAQLAAVVLAKLALARGSDDNISVIVVELKKPCKCAA